MKAQEMALRNEIRQMMNEAGINRNNIKDYIKSIIDEVIDKQVAQAYNERSETLVEKLDDMISKRLNHLMVEAIQKSITNKLVTNYFSNLRVRVEFPDFEKMQKEINNDEQR